MKPTRSRHGLTGGRWLRLLPGLTLALIILPIAAGLAGTLLPSLGYLPQLGGRSLSVAPWRMLFSAPELPAALLATLVSGLLATLLSLAAAVGIAATLHGTRFHHWLRRLLAPLLAMPHAALAIGFAFLISPSGWLMRLAAPLAAPDGLPPDLPLVGDRLGLALAVALVLKETPFLLLAIFAGLGQLPADAALVAARMLGYRPATAWLKVVLPQLYRQLRLPIYAVLAFSLSVVDMALILGPSTPPALAPLLLRWFNDADLASLFPAAAGAVLQILLVAAAIVVWRAGEVVVAIAGRRWLVDGRRGHFGRAGRWLGVGAAGLLLALAAGSMLALAFWSFAMRWRFPALLPQDWTLANWSSPMLEIARPLGTSLALGLASTAIALLLTIGCLENERRHGVRPKARVLWLLYLPLLTPQISFLFGTQALFAWLGIEASLPALVWSHLLFVLPYVFLLLADPYRALDERYIRAGLCLGAGRGRVFGRLVLPMLLRPILVAAAVGFGVSVALYLPTLSVGAGRFETLTTEAVARASGGDRRLAGVFGFLQAALPFAGFTLALLAVRLAFRNRRGLMAGAVRMR
ncbi:MAG: putative thiamine transport system permease protein [Rhodospirillaceae bacterium]|nr:putative thiamine transport system permease protein [Rhodospirillaceae bacterium]